MAKINRKIFRNPSVYITDRGFTKKAQEVPVEVTKVDSSWLKASLAEGAKSGTVKGASTYQSFVPYQTQFESKKSNRWGIVKQSDKENPWVDYTEDEWYDSVNFPPDFRGIFDIEGWYANKLETPKELYQWKTDIFGNQYGLYKHFGTPTAPISLYYRAHSTGDLWVCNSTGRVQPANTALSAIYLNHFTANHYTTYSNLTANIIEDIDVFYDTLMIVTPDEVVLDKILFDYDTGEISSLPDYTHMYNISATIGGKFADSWFFEEEKRIVLCGVVLLSGIPVPHLYDLDLETNDYNPKFPLSISDLSDLQALSGLNLTTIDYPTFTYNPDTQNYNIALFANNASGQQLILITMDETENIFVVKKVSTITYTTNITT